MIIPNLVLTNTNPVVTYTASVVTSGSVIADALGNQITYLHLTCSYSDTASVQTSWEESSSYSSQSFWSTSASFASHSISSSWVPNLYPQTYQVSGSWATASLTSSNFSPSQGTVSDAGSLTGSVSASGYGFTTDVEFNTFVTSISSSMQQLNSLLTKLRAVGIIS